MRFFNISNEFGSLGDGGGSRFVIIEDAKDDDMEHGGNTDKGCELTVGDDEEIFDV